MRMSPSTFIRFVSKRRERTERNVVFPLPLAPIMAQRPPLIHPFMLLRIVLGSFPLRAFVETQTLFQVKTAGASEGEMAAKTPFSSMYSP